MHEVLVNRLGGQSLPKKNVVRLTDRPDMTLDVYRGRKITTQQLNVIFAIFVCACVPSVNIFICAYFSIGVFHADKDSFQQR